MAVAETPRDDVEHFKVRVSTNNRRICDFLSDYFHKKHLTFSVKIRAIRLISSF